MFENFMLAVNVAADLNLDSIDLPADTLDTKILKQSAPGAPVREHVSIEEEEDARMAEIDAINAFVAQHGVKTPVAEDFAPKSLAWRSKKSAEKFSKKKTNSAKGEGRGRPRQSFVKDLSFIVLEDGTFKRAGRGRAKKGQVRETFTVHHTNVDKACAGTHTREALVAMAKVVEAS